MPPVELGGVSLAWTIDAIKLVKDVNDIDWHVTFCDCQASLNAKTEKRRSQPDFWNLLWSQTVDDRDFHNFPYQSGLSNVTGTNLNLGSRYRLLVQLGCSTTSSSYIYCILQKKSITFV